MIAITRSLLHFNFVGGLVVSLVLFTSIGIGEMSEEPTATTDAKVDDEGDKTQPNDELVR